MLVYHYHHESGDYMGYDEADPSPLEPGVYLIPANATSTPPPSNAPEGKKWVWQNQVWELQDRVLDETTITDPVANPWDVLRALRNKLLAQSDFRFLKDYTFATPEKEQEWRDYRQALRDLPQNTVDPINAVFPSEPQ